MNKNTYTFIISALAFLLAVLVSCTGKDDIQTDLSGNAGLSFGISTAWRNSDEPLTRTAYSSNFFGTSSEWERIDWVVGDRIRVVASPAATESGVNWADYKIDSRTVDTTDPIRSNAAATPAADSLKWNKAGVDHCFYALYPAATQSGVTASEATLTIATDGKSATATGVIKPVQTYTGVSTKTAGGITTTEYLPDMKYAYMYAATRVIPAKIGTGPVELDFKPLFSAIAFSITPDDPDVYGYKLTSVTLASRNNATGNDVTGSFSANFSYGTDNLTGTFSKPTVTDAGRSVTMDIAAGDQVALSADREIKLTLFTLPVEQRGMSVTFTFDNAGATVTRTLELRDTGTWHWVRLGSGKKLYVSNKIPSIEYTFEVTGPSSIFARNNSSNNIVINNLYTVKSYRSKGGSSEIWPWTAEYSLDYGHTWTTTKPEWILDFTDSDTGSLTAKSYKGAVNNNQGTGDIWGATVAATAAQARNLALYNIYGDKLGGSDDNPWETANCYVVSAPGWYKIPLVYGNGFKHGLPNPNAYTASPADPKWMMVGGFLNHAGNQITAPWISKAAPDGMGVSVDGAKLVWQDAQNMIPYSGADKPFVQDNYLYFKVDAIARGNAVVAVTSGGTIVWSWHIWAMDNPRVKLGIHELYSNPNKWTCYANPSKILNVDLGFNEGTVSIQPRYCWVRFTQADSRKQSSITLMQNGAMSDASVCYYQWGRKDPMWPGKGNAGTTVYLDNGSSVNSNTSIKVMGANSANSSVPGSIKYPDYFFKGLNGSRTTWSGQTDASGNDSTTPGVGRFDNLWNTGVPRFTNTQDEYYDYPVTKTIYDPCPVGFRVPSEFAFTGFNLEALHNSTYGYSQYVEALLPTLTAQNRYYAFYLNPEFADGGVIIFYAFGRRYGYDMSASQAAGKLDVNMINNTEGYWWTAAGTGHNGSVWYGRSLYIRISQHKVYPVYGTTQFPGYLRSHGIPVRPVADE